MQVKKYDEDGRPYIEISEGFTVRVDTDELPEEYKEKAQRELRETPENVEKGLKELRELIDADDTLYVPSDYDEYLIKFLRVTKFYAESAYKLMRRYYEFKKKYPHVCSNLVPETARLAFQHGYINFQPRRDQHGRAIVLIRCGRDWDPSVVPVTTVFRALQLGVEVGMLEPMTQVNGFVLIFDFLDLTLKQCLYARPRNSRMMMEFLQECTPLRVKAVHIVNYPLVFQILWSIYRQFLNGKLRDKIFFHGDNFDSLREHIDAGSLRSYYGGTMECEDVDGKLVAELLEETTDEFALASSFGIVDNKHLIKSKEIPQSILKKVGMKNGPKRKLSEA